MDRIERGAKSVLAECFLRSKGDTMKEREQLALVDAQYLKYLADWDKAEKEKIKAMVEYDNLKTSFDALQSALSHQKAELSRGM